MVVFIRTIAFINALSLVRFGQSAVVDNCPCGYKTDGTSVYTEAIETDFTNILDVATLVVDWQIQEWKINLKPSANVPFNRVAQTVNVIPGNVKGLQMLVKPVNGLDVGTSEIRTVRDDIKYGSFRVSIQTTTVNGTCSAFFWVSIPSLIQNAS
jgi:hypothetical protein